jgi:hypothetical protein
MPPPSPARVPTPIDDRRLDRVEDQTDEHAREIRDVEREVVELGGKVDALRVGIEAHERLDVTRHDEARASFARLEAGQAALVKSIETMRDQKAAATGELAATERVSMTTRASTIAAIIGGLVTIAGIIYQNAPPIPPAPAPHSGLQQQVEATWQDKRAEEVREDAVEGAVEPPR